MSERGAGPGYAAIRAAGLSVEEAARRAGMSVGYLRRLCRQGGAPFVAAERLSVLLGCPIETFVYRTTTEGGGTRPSARGARPRRRRGGPGPRAMSPDGRP